MKTLACAARGTRQSLHCSIAILTLALSIGPGCGDDKKGASDAGDAGDAASDAGADVGVDVGAPDAPSDGPILDAADGGIVDGSDDGGDGSVADRIQGLDLSPPDLVDAPPREWVLLTDFEGNGDLTPFWALFVGGTMTGDSGDAPTGALVPARGSSRQAMHLQGPAVADGAVINTHQNFDWTALFTGVRFWARGTGDQPTEILVALTDLRSPTELYYAGLRAGRPWRVKRLRLTSEWQQFSVTFDELAPEGAGTPVPVFGTGARAGGELHFIVAENRAYDFWIDDVELGCRPGKCGPGFF